MGANNMCPLSWGAQTENIPIFLPQSFLVDFKLISPEKQMLFCPMKNF